MSVKRRNGSGNWEVRIYFKNPQGRKEIYRKSKETWTKKQAERHEREVRDAMEDGSFWKSWGKQMPTFGEFAEKYMEIYTAGNEDTTISAKRGILDNHVLPFFGKIPIDQITVGCIKEYRARKLKEGLKAKTVNNQVTVIRRVLGEAAEEEVIPFAPSLRKLKEEQPDFDWLRHGEDEQLLAGAENNFWRAMIQIALHTGLRQSELLGLQWTDVHIEEDINRCLIKVVRTQHRGNIKPTKNKRLRYLGMTWEVRKALQSLPKKGLWVFSDESGNFLTDNECKHPLERAWGKAELRRVGWHMLRHTFASHMVQEGATLKEVQDALGHSSINMVLRYAHLSPEANLSTVHRLSRNSTSTAHERRANE